MILTKNDKKEIKDVKKLLRIYESPVELFLDDLYENYDNNYRGTIMLIEGSCASGKTNLACQITNHFNDKNKRSLYIDCDNLFQSRLLQVNKGTALIQPNHQKCNLIQILDFLTGAINQNLDLVVIDGLSSVNVDLNKFTETLKTQFHEVQNLLNKNNTLILITMQKNEAKTQYVERLAHVVCESSIISVKDSDPLSIQLNVIKNRNDQLKSSTIIPAVFNVKDSI
jgi:archaellum biogenesis ATPase FlaH